MQGALSNITTSILSESPKSVRTCLRQRDKRIDTERAQLALLSSLSLLLSLCSVSYLYLRTPTKKTKKKCLSNSIKERRSAASAAACGKLFFQTKPKCRPAAGGFSLYTTSTITTTHTRARALSPARYRGQSSLPVPVALLKPLTSLAYHGKNSGRYEMILRPSSYLLACSPPQARKTMYGRRLVFYGVGGRVGEAVGSAREKTSELQKKKQYSDDAATNNIRKKNSK